MTVGDPYVIPGTNVLRNLLGFIDPVKLDRAERRIVAERATQPIPHGNFDLKHLRAIHRHLFQDIYDWAGELRTVEISKGDQQFQFRQYIPTGMADVHRRLVQPRFLKGLVAEDFAGHAAVIQGDINYVHPFREGNGRTQLQYPQATRHWSRPHPRPDPHRGIGMDRGLGRELCGGLSAHGRALEKALKPAPGGR